MKKTTILAISLISVFLVNCGKKEIVIGRTNPELEIKKCIHLSEKKKYEETIQCLEMFKARFPKSPQGTEAELRIGNTYFQKKDYLLAADAYESFVQMHPYHEKADYAYYKMGICYFKETPRSIARDQEYLDDAIYNFEYLLTNFPNSTYKELGQQKLNEARLKFAKRHYYVGRFYFRTGEYKAAGPRFEEVITNYPETNLIEKSLYKLVLSNLKLSNVDKAKFYYSKMLDGFADKKYTKKAYKKILAAQKS